MTNNTKLLELLNNAKKSGFYSVDIEKLENAILENIQEENAKKNGNKSELTIIKSLLKSNKNNTNFLGYFPYKNKYAFLDGHRIIILDNNLGYEQAKKFFDIEKISNDLSCNAEKIIIDINDLKNQISINKATKQENIYTFTHNNVTCFMNAKYLMDAYNISKNNVFYCDIKTSISHNCNASPFYQLDNENNLKNFILPVIRAV